MSAPNPECTLCGGTGMVGVDTPPPHPPSFRRCGCVIHRDVLQNVENALVGLSKAPVIPSSPLLGRTEENLWVTAGEVFLAHLRHAAIRKPSAWSFRVVSDAELTTAWLASIALQGKDILDADAYVVSTKYITIPDLVMPPKLLILQMGVKVTRNSAASECLGEALNIRQREGLATWVWDEPSNPLDVGHLFWSDTVHRILRPWGRIQNLSKSPAGAAKSAPGASKLKQRKALR